VKKEKGFTLIEFMVVIALIGIALLFIIMQFKDTGDQNKSQNAVKNISQVAVSASEFKGRRVGYANVNQSVLMKSSSIPEGMKVGGALTNLFGGAIIVSSVGAAAPWNNNYIQIEYPSLPKYACVNIAGKMISKSFSTSPSVHGVQVKKNGAGAMFPIASLADASANCGASNNILYFIFE